MEVGGGHRGARGTTTVRRSRRGERAVAVAAGGLGALWAIGAVLGADPPGSASSTAATSGAAAAPVRVAEVTQVVRPDGARTAAPADLVGWLARHPDVRVLSVRRFRGGGWGSTSAGLARGVRAVSVEYELTTAAVSPLRRVAGLPLFCTDAGGAAACSRLVEGVRVRSTFVEGDAPPVLVESRWRAGRMPDVLRQAHRSTVLDVVRRSPTGVFGDG